MVNLFKKTNNDIHETNGSNIPMTYNACDLHCMKDSKYGSKDGGKVHEFSGPVKIILVDPPEEQYGWKKTGAAFLALANMMMGANVVLVMLFTLAFRLPFYNNLHIVLCTLGYQFFMPSAILMLSSLNGAASPLKKSDRRIEHIMIHILGLALALCGTYYVYYYGEPPSITLLAKDKMTSYHYNTGMATAILCVLCVLTGPIALTRKSELMTSSIITGIHRLFGMVTFFVATVCFVLGILKPSFQLWLFIVAYLSPTFFMMFFTVFYAAIVLTTPGNNFKTLKLSFWKNKNLDN